METEYIQVPPPFYSHIPPVMWTPRSRVGLIDFPCLILGQEWACDLILTFETGWKGAGLFHEKFEAPEGKQ